MHQDSIEHSLKLPQHQPVTVEKSTMCESSSLSGQYSVSGWYTVHAVVPPPVTGHCVYCRLKSSMTGQDSTAHNLCICSLPLVWPQWNTVQYTETVQCQDIVVSLSNATSSLCLCSSTSDSSLKSRRRKRSELSGRIKTVTLDRETSGWTDRHVDQQTKHSEAMTIPWTEKHEGGQTDVWTDGKDAVMH